MVKVVELKVKEFEENVDRMIGLDKEIFEKLSDDYAPHYYSLTWQGIVKTHKSHISTLSPRTALFLTLFHFRTGLCSLDPSLNCVGVVLVLLHRR